MEGHFSHASIIAEAPAGNKPNSDPSEFTCWQEPRNTPNAKTNNVVSPEATPKVENWLPFISKASPPSDTSEEVWSTIGMAILEVRVIPDPVLRVTTTPVDVFDSKLHAFLDDMYDTMVSSHGIGLAAPQVGDTRRIAIMDLSVDGVQQPIITSLGNHDPNDHLYNGRLEMINPSVVRSGTPVSSDEGCLSIPDYRDSIKRHGTITITSFDRHGNKFQCEAEELTAFCIQHEMDHLDGILFVDRLSRLKKQLFRRWCVKNNFQFQERA